MIYCWNKATSQYSRNENSKHLRVESEYHQATRYCGIGNVGAEQGDGASTTSTARAPRKAAYQAPKRQARDVRCAICKFKTTPHHDGRMHRSQKDEKGIHCRGTHGKGSHEGWVISSFASSNEKYESENAHSGNSRWTGNPAPPQLILRATDC
jgi:hypothetical protein